jgi:4-hydroxy-2-oxovalerate aldolase
LEAAAKSLKKAKFGMFFIPGIGRKKTLDLAAKYKMDFVRIGTNVTEVEQAEPYIKYAKELGFLVFSNLMKSYALPIDEFIKKAELASRYGADVIVVVDSAGGMMPEEVHNYISRIKREIGVKVGFHGHNNLLLAIANTVEAVKAGAEIVDSSLQGIGRSAGNAQTEILVMVLEKLGYSTEVDLYKTMDLGEKVLRSMMGAGKGVDSINAILGYAQFHSSYLKIIYKIAQKYNIDPRELIVKVSEVNRIRVTEELVEKISHEVKKERKEQMTQRFNWNINIDFNSIITKHATLEENAKAIALELLSLGKKAGKQTVFTIAGTSNKKKKEASFPFIRQNAIYIIGNAEVVNSDEAVRIAKAIDGYVDYILVDVDRHGGHLVGMAGKVKRVVKVSKVLTYKDSDAQVNAVDALLGQLLDNLENKKVVILGNNIISRKLVFKLSDRGGEVICLSHTSQFTERKIDVLIGITPFKPVVDLMILKQLKRGGIIIDAGPGSISPRVIPQAHKIGVSVYRIDMRAGLSGEIINVLETYELRKRIMGEKKIAGVRVVAGGVIGRKGDIVIDSISHPLRVIGVADGRGGLIKNNEAKIFISKIKRVKLSIARAMFL